MRNAQCACIVTYRIAHLSDCHLGPLPPASLGDLMSKRVFGYLNWKRNRAKTFAPDTTQNLVDDLLAHKPDHVVVTGDLVNIALEAEFENAGRFLHTLGSPHDVTVIPGNHDAYVPGALARFNHHCTDFLTSDDPANGEPTYPVVRQRGPVNLIGLSTAVATAPLMATGYVDADQLRRMDDAMQHTPHLFQMVLIHHPPFDKAGPGYKRLVNAAEVREHWQQTSPHLVLHGHTHLATRRSVLGSHGDIPVYGVSSAAQALGGHRPPASYNLFDIESTESGWQVEATRRGYQADKADIDELSCESLAYLSS